MDKNKKVLEKTIGDWVKDHPLLEDIMAYQEVLWLNPKLKHMSEAIKKIRLDAVDVKEAKDRLERFAPYIKKVFPETAFDHGIIESPLKEIPRMKAYLEKAYNCNFQGKLFLKCDSHLAISGSIKARGGIYEVLKYAETLALGEGLLSLTDDYSLLDSDQCRRFFAQYTVAVGSTGNLGLSIGIMSAKLGFKVFVHMSSDSKLWKKDLLKSKGVNVIEYDSDYSKAVEEGRKQSDADSMSYFVDDESSIHLFLGYAVAASRLKKQLDIEGVEVNIKKPLFVYLPCGVGGGPGGVTFGLKLIFGDAVHCFFAEPTHSPCMLLGCMTEKHDHICVQDFGLDNHTVADGLAVGRSSGFVGKTLEGLLSGVYTINDEVLFVLLKMMSDVEDFYLEPSALAGVAGIIRILNSQVGRRYIQQNGLGSYMQEATHIAWATGGSMVPKEVMMQDYKRGHDLALKEDVKS